MNLVNESAEKDGWLVKISYDEENTDYAHLMDLNSYNLYVEEDN